MVKCVGKKRWWTLVKHQKKTDDKLKKENLEGFFTSEVLNDLLLGHIGSVLLNHILRHLPLGPRPAGSGAPSSGGWRLRRSWPHSFDPQGDASGPHNKWWYKWWCPEDKTEGPLWKCVEFQNPCSSHVRSCQCFFSMWPKRKPGRFWMILIKN